MFFVIFIWSISSWKFWKSCCFSIFVLEFSSSSDMFLTLRSSMLFLCDLEIWLNRVISLSPTSWQVCSSSSLKTFRFFNYENALSVLIIWVFSLPFKCSHSWSFSLNFTFCYFNFWVRFSIILFQFLFICNFKSCSSLEF